MGIAVDNALRDPLDRSGDSFEIALISSSNSTGIQEFHISVLAGGYGISDGNILVFLDINDYKVYNDIYGHEAGDRALVSLARELTALMKKCMGNIQKDRESCLVPKVLNLPFRGSHRRILFCSVYLIISCLSGTLIDQNKSYVGLISADRSYTGVYPYIVFHRHVIISVCRFQTAFLSEDAVDITVYQCSIIIILLNQKICRIGTVYPFRTVF